MKHPIRAALIAASAAIGLSGCVTDDYGYGYSGVSVGYGSGFYDSSPYWGWYDNYYYPGTGYYIYDHSGRRHRWSDNHRRYWEGRRGGLSNRELRENWRDFQRDRRQNNQQFRSERRLNREAFRSGQIDRDQFRAERRQLRQERRQEMRQDRREFRREMRRDRRD
jgi:hypothetical protein